MWEVLERHPRGRMSLRNLPLLAAVFIAALFAGIFTPGQAFAADIERTANGFTYNGKQFNTKMSIAAGDPRALTTGQPVTAYEYNDTASNTTEYIYFANGVDPATATSGAYIAFDHVANTTTYTQKGSPQSIPITTSANPPPAQNTPAAGVTPSAQNAGSSCTVGNGTGWVVCPVGNTIASWVDGLYDIVMTFMDVKPMLAGSPLYDIWNAVRAIANVVFVIAFLVVILSQVTSLGISAYGIRKILPRLIIAAILVNISYYICALAIDLSNFLGHAVYSFIMGYAQSLNNFASAQFTWQDIMTGLFSAQAGATIAIGTLWFSVATAGSLAAAVFTALGMLLGVVTAAVVALVILVARQALLVIFTIVSPLAFVALVLPSTEKWFGKWREAFTTMLVMFPLFSLVFGGALLAGGAIVLSAGNNLFLIILGKAVQIIPLAITPLIVRFSTGILGTIAQLTNNRRKGLLDRAKNWTDSQADFHRRRSLAQNNRRHLNPFRGIAQGLDSHRKSQEERLKGYDAASMRRVQSTARYRSAYNFAREQELNKDTSDNELKAGWDEARRSGTTNRWGRVNTSAVQSELANRAAQVNAKKQSERLERMHEDIAAEGSVNPHLQKLNIQNVTLRNAVLANADAIKLDTEKIAFEGMAKRFAEAQQKSNVAERLNSSEELRNEIGRIRGTEGASLAHASAIAEERKQFGEMVSARQEIMKHFKVSAEETADLSMGKDVQKERDGHTVTFKADDQYTREAAIERIFQVGAYKNIMEVIESTGVGGINYDYRATALDAFQKNGKSKTAPFLNDKAYDIVLNGKWEGEKTTREQVVRRIMEGRITAADLAGAHANAITSMFESQGNGTGWSDARTTMFGGDAAKAASYAQNYRSMQAAAVDVLRDNQLRQNTSTESVNTLKRYLGINVTSLDGYDWDALENRLGLK